MDIMKNTVRFNLSRALTGKPPYILKYEDIGSGNNRMRKFTVFLDSHDSTREGKAEKGAVNWRFNWLYGTEAITDSNEELIPGLDLTLQVTVRGAAANEWKSEEKEANSLFAGTKETTGIIGKTAIISNARHLQNLNRGEIMTNGGDVVEKSYGSDINFFTTTTTRPHSKIRFAEIDPSIISSGINWAAYAYRENFASIITNYTGYNNKLDSFNGNNVPINGLDGPLFESLENQQISNAAIANPRINKTQLIPNFEVYLRVGALAKFATNSTITNCHVYAINDGTGEGAFINVSTNETLTYDASIGGLIGTTTLTTSITNCSVSLPEFNIDVNTSKAVNVGGLVGSGGSDIIIRDSFAQFGVANGTGWQTGSGLILNGRIDSVAGILGTTGYQANGSVVSSYVKGIMRINTSVPNGKTAGILYTSNTGTVTNSYGALEYDISAGYSPTIHGISNTVTITDSFYLKDADINEEISFTDENGVKTHDEIQALIDSE